MLVVEHIEMVNIAEEKYVRQEGRRYLACGRPLGAVVWIRGIIGGGVGEGTGRVGTREVNPRSVGGSKMQEQIERRENDQLLSKSEQQ